MDYIFGYGSLLSTYSRETYSNIDSVAELATVSGWSRSWCVSYADEGATYAGAVRDDAAELDGVLILSEVNESIADRERGYQFTLLDVNDISLSFKRHKLSSEDRIWLCETLRIDTPSSNCPLPQSYVDTCISGCIESRGIGGANRFIQQTAGWDCVWVNDRHLDQPPIYPRYTPVSAKQGQQIDSLLDEQGVLQFRQARSI